MCSKCSSGSLRLNKPRANDLGEEHKEKREKKKKRIRKKFNKRKSPSQVEMTFGSFLT